MVGQYLGPSQSNQNFGTTITPFDDRDGTTMARTFAAGTLQIGDRLHLIGSSEHGNAEATERAAMVIEISADGGTSYTSIAIVNLNQPTAGATMFCEADVSYVTGTVNQTLACFGRGWSVDSNIAYAVATRETFVTGVNHAANAIIVRLSAFYVTGAPGAARNWKAGIFEIDLR
jgi:hypothetical protein